MKTIVVEDFIIRPNIIILTNDLSKSCCSPASFISYENHEEICCNNENVILQWKKNPSEAWLLYNVSIMLYNYQESKYIACYSRFDRICGTAPTETCAFLKETFWQKIKKYLSLPFQESKND